MAVHPFGYEVACGDRAGRIKLFDLRDMARPKRCIQAHESEVLTLNYSPILRSTSDATVPGSKSSPDSVLLASGGRDNLVHIFDTRGPSSGALNLLTTLHLHESPVTIVKFTPDGQRLISCGNSDQMMVFCRVSVDGDTPSVSKLKGVPTPHGSVNGIAIDATNKYAITSGQDKRLNIWNINSGRQMRSYRLENAAGELYKSDIDPSG
jgi:WD40 repeat protein